MISEEKLKKIADIMNTLTEEYADYYRIRERIDIDRVNVKIWSKGYIEPFSCDYITDMFDNTVEPRKLMKAPRKKEYVSFHYMNEETPLYSVYYGNNDDIYIWKNCISPYLTDE